MEKIKFLKQSSLVFLLSLSLLVGCNGNQNPPNGESPAPSPAGSSASSSPPGKEKTSKLTRAQYEKSKAQYDLAKQQARDDWGEFKNAYDDFRKPKTTFQPVKTAYKTAYNKLIKDDNNVTHSKSVLSKDVKKKILAIGGEPLKENPTVEDKKKYDETPLGKIELVLLSFKSSSVETIEGQLKTITGKVDTKINEIDRAIKSDTAFIAPPVEPLVPTSEWQKLALFIILGVGGVGLIAWVSMHFLGRSQTNRSRIERAKTPVRGGIGTQTLTTNQKRQQQSTSPRNLSEDDYAVLFTAINHVLEQRGIRGDTSNISEGQREDNRNYPSYSPEEIINIVRGNLPALLNQREGSQIVTRVLSSPRLEKKILEIIREESTQRGYQRNELAQEGYQRGGQQKATTHNQQPVVSYSSPAVPKNHQNYETYHRPQLPGLVEQYRNFYNDPQKQERGEVARQFGKIAAELEETKESYDRRAYQYSASQHIELETVSKNQGSFWLIVTEENSPEGWLFPKTKIKSTYHKAVETLFEVEGALNSYNYIEIIKPAQMMTSDGGQIWKIGKKGRIQLLS